MENLTQTSRQITEFVADYDEGEKLSQFLNTMEKFNDGQPLNEYDRTQIIDYFHYRWKNDRNHFLSTEYDEFMLD